MLSDIKDNGIGIEAEHQKKIFERFYRINDGELHTSKGFGLGLNFVKKVIDTHHGKIEVASELGSGSTFTIKLSRHQFLMKHDNELNEINIKTKGKEFERIKEALKVLTADKGELIIHE